MVRLQLADRGIADDRVLDAMGAVPREQFVPEHLRAKAYDDAALPAHCHQTISQPFIVAYMTERLDLTPAGKVLEIGTGTGYQTAVLARLCGQVYSVERIPSLADTARARLAQLGVTNATIVVGDGTLGLAVLAPYDRIIVTAAAARLPGPLVRQLAAGGKLIAPVGPPALQRLTLLERKPQGLSETALLECRFVKLIGRAGWKP
ncbi:MAG: protein-L-isoaspartate(D-aspartate) O-methyltransferase [Phycisphaerae bacterium]